MKPVLRFAPSPNGELHLGHAYSALLNYDLARQWGGRFLLRIEDIDTTRCTPEFEAGIYRDLEWLGIEWETPARRQSEHFEAYRAALDRLIAQGLVYPAFMSRGEIRAHIVEAEARGQTWPRDPDGAPLYPGRDKQLSEKERETRLASGKSFAWRLDVEKAELAVGRFFDLASGVAPTSSRLRRATPPPAPQGEGIGASLPVVAPIPNPTKWGRGGSPKAGRGGRDSVPEKAKLLWREVDPFTNEITPIPADPSLWGDVIVARSDIPTSYHLAVTLDDALQAATHIVRGQDLYHATSVHRLLQTLLGLPQPIYHHHKLILGADGRKLAKSEKSAGLRSLREAGVTPAQIREMIGLNPAA